MPIDDVLLANHTPLAAVLTASVPGGLSRCVVVGLDADGLPLVLIGHDTGQPRVCDVLDSIPGGVNHLCVGDSVLAWIGENSTSRPIVVGRVVGAQLPSSRDTLVIEANEALTLRVGDGSITIRKDGKILIKGKDLVSVAERMNRIKGGAVSIN